MNNIRYNIRLNINTLKTLFEYFKMDENNTIIELNTKREKVRENIQEYKDNILLVNDESIFLKKLPFGKLYYFLSKNFIAHVVFYKEKNIKNIDKSEVKIDIRNDKIHGVSFNDKYDYKETKALLKKYRTIDIEYIVLFLLLVGGIIVYFLKH